MGRAGARQRRLFVGVCTLGGEGAGAPRELCHLTAPQPACTVWG